MSPSETSTAAPSDGNHAAIHFPSADDWLSEAELNTLTPASLRDRMCALKPEIAALARETELARRPLDSVWQSLRRSGIFYHFVPKRYGGLEFGFEDLIDIMLPVAEACASTGWVGTFCVEHNFLLAQFPVEAQDEIFGSQPYVIMPGAASPPGEAARVDGGYLVSGQWSWGSGVMNADWIMAQAAVTVEGAASQPPRMLYALFPATEVEVIDTWHMAGMAGTGSNDFIVNRLFVPEHRTLDAQHFLEADGPGALSHSNPMYRVPMVPFTSTTTAIPALGAARAAVDFYRTRLATRTLFSTSIKLIDRPPSQIRLAHADVLTQTAETILRGSCRLMESTMQTGELIDSVMRRRIRANNAFAVTLCRDAIDLVAAGSGAGAHSLNVALQRYQRDCNVVSGHALYDMDVAYEQYGRALLGLEPVIAMY